MENEPQSAYLPKGDTETLAPFDVREQSSSRGMLWLAGGVGILVLLAIVMLNLFSSGTRGRGQTPRILADSTPYKEVPLVRGGEQAPNQDKEIYQKLNGTLQETPVKTMPVAEQPLPKPLPMPQRAEANIVIKEPVVEKPAVRVKPQISKPIIQSIAGDYVVQVASLRTHAEANILWDTLTKKMNGIITTAHSPNVKRADLGNKGIYYRLRVGGLREKKDAEQLCTRLKSRGQDCIVTKK